MQDRRTLFIIALGVLVLWFVLSYRDTLSGLLVLGGIGVVVVVLPVALIIGLVLLIIRRLFPSAQQSAASPALSSPEQPTPVLPVTTTPLTQRLQTAFRRNQTTELDRLLRALPEWPIAQQLRATAHVLLTLKQSSYRAQAEGVPSHIVQRYLTSTQQASESIWELASKLNALEQQQIAYHIVAGRLEQEAHRLSQLQQSAQAAHEGIALLIVSGIQSQAVQQADEDLADLTTAIKLLMQANTTVPQSVPTTR